MNAFLIHHVVFSNKHLQEKLNLHGMITHLKIQKGFQIGIYPYVEHLSQLSSYILIGLNGNNKKFRITEIKEKD